MCKSRTLPIGRGRGRFWLVSFWIHMLISNSMQYYHVIWAVYWQQLQGNPASNKSTVIKWERVAESNFNSGIPERNHTNNGPFTIVVEFKEKTKDIVQLGTILFNQHCVSVWPHGLVHVQFFDRSSKGECTDTLKMKMANQMKRKERSWVEIVITRTV